MTHVQRCLRIAMPLVVAAALAIPSQLAAFPNITGKTNKSVGAGCAGNGCHGGQTAEVTITGPATLNVGQKGSYTVTLSGSSKTGVNIAASHGTLASTTTNLVLSGGELTFSGPRNSSTWTFDYTPQTAGAETLYAAGVINGRPGTWNHAANFPVTVATVAGVDDSQPASFNLRQNYPNPFNPSTMIGFTLPERAYARLEVFSVTGAHVATLADGMREAGSYDMPFRADNLPSGVYLYRLQAGGVTSTRRMLLLR